MVRRTSEPQESAKSQSLFCDADALARMVETCVRNLINEEFTAHVGAQPYERTDERRDQRNGTKPRTLKTRVGELHFDVPQARSGGFYPSVFESYQRQERALIGLLQEITVAGVSTRGMADVLEAMGGFSVSSATVSRAMVELDDEIARFRTRPLSHCEYPYLIIDARYEKIRTKGHVVNQAVMVAAGITDEGRREVLGHWVGDSESEDTWGAVFKDLKGRGLRGLEIVLSDAHAGIRAALARHFQGVAWQRCQVHLMRELLKKVGWRDYKELAKDLRGIFVSGSKAVCLRVADEVATKWHERAPKMSKALLAGIEDCLTVQEMPGEIARRLRSTNMIERLMRTIKARTRGALLFPNEASCIRLVGAVLLDVHDQWITEPKRYLNLDRL